MELNELKSTWNAVKTPVITSTEILGMLSENKHPVLKSIKRQFTIEIIVWSIFLVCYYSMFDGAMKPLWINILVISSVLLPIAHNLMGYSFSKHLINGDNIHESLRNYISKVKAYAVTSIISRQIYLLGILLFFTYGINFTSSKYISLAVIIVIILIQLWLSYSIWAKRLKNLRNSIISLQDQ